MDKKLKAVDFFCGAGGMSCGFSQAGVEILAGIDLEKQFKETYLANHKGAKFINRDIVRYQPQELQEELNLNKFDDQLIFIGCSPCQYWSKINNVRHKSSFSNNLIADFQRFIKFFVPGYVVVENVPGIIKSKNNHVLLDFLDFLKFNGYSYEYKVVRTDHFGVPQKRNRFVLIASRVSTNIQFPSPELREDLTVKKFIGKERGFPVLPAGYSDPEDFMNTTASLSPKNLKRLEVTPHNGGDRMSWKDDESLQIEAYRGKDHYYRSVYGRLWWDRPSTTITTRFIATSCGRFGHPDENRGLSLREGAALQTFPTDYKFVGGLVSIAKQIGNAVPPEMARRIALSIIQN
ncbi:DNA cytosine methyltransferase [Lunatimonas salinarum]|uniref:DNA cytosine methyltransferase n=1 Tax=Lunatimonas salinarum TaxID=1774590 RepID=UPI001AE0B487|nr:DNA cytosine methyltransferase [Lunatimonas salinarum]